MTASEEAEPEDSIWERGERLALDRATEKKLLGSMMAPFQQGFVEGYVKGFDEAIALIQRYPRSLK